MENQSQSVLQKVVCLSSYLHNCICWLSCFTDPNRNVILWQDHRAKQEAIEINSLHHPVLRYVGGALSPEMQPPKLLWLKKHLRQDCWERAGYFFDLADYLTYRATGVCSRLAAIRNHLPPSSSLSLSLSHKTFSMTS